MNKRTIGNKIFDVVNVLIMIVLACIMLYPILHVLFASISDSALVMQHRGLLLRPLGFNLNAYKAVLEDARVFIGYRNTLIVLIGGVAVNIVLTCIGAYFLTRKNVFWQKPIMILITATMFISGGLVPFYLVVRNIGIADTLWALILPVAINTYNLIIMRTGFAAIPDSLEEAAKIDGASDEWILVFVMVPLAMPTIAVLILYYAVFHWNAWFNAMIFLRKRDLYPLQLILREILIQNQTDQQVNMEALQNAASVSESIKYATIMVSVVPALCIYPFLQKYFVKGVMVGAVKG